MKNPTYAFKDTSIVLQFIYEPRIRLQIKSKTVMSWKSQKKKKSIFCNLWFACRNILHLLFCLFLKSSNIFTVFLSKVQSLDWLT